MFFLIWNCFRYEGCGRVFGVTDMYDSFLLCGASKMRSPVKEYNCVNSRRALSSRKYVKSKIYDGLGLFHSYDTSVGFSVIRYGLFY